MSVAAESGFGERVGSPHQRMEAVRVYNVYSCALVQSCSGIAAAENTLKSRQASRRIISWHPAVQWDVGASKAFGSGLW